MHTRAYLAILPVPVVVAALAAGACGGSPNKATGGHTSSSSTVSTGGGQNATTPNSTVNVSADAAAPIPLKDLCPVFSNDLCVYLMQCSDYRYRDIAHCLSEVDCYGLPELTAAAQSGAVTYDPSAVGVCSARFLGDPCHFGGFFGIPDIFEVLAFCPGALVPNLKQGAPCVSPGECGSGLTCQKTNNKCPGTCTPTVKAGDACTTSCGSWLTCVNGCDATNLWCDVTAQTCKPGVGEGAACGTLDGGASEVICQADLWCDAVFLGGPGVCRKGSPKGGPCYNSASCLGELRCLGKSVSSHGTCAPASASGGACMSSSDCVAGLRCDATTATCGALLSAGGKCFGDSDCTAGLVCQGEVCVGPRYPGDPCGDAGAWCTFGVCKNGVCAATEKAGQPCGNNTDCTTGTCYDGGCVDTTVCRP